MKDVVGYIRVSRVNGRGGDSFLSPELQREAIERVALSKGLRVVKFFQELDASGGDANRPEWNEAISMCETGEVDGIAVWNLARFSRSTQDALSTLKRVESNGAKLYSASEDFDTSTPEGKAMRSQMFVWAEMERDRARAGWMNSVAKAVDRGVAPNKPPLGYSKDEDGRFVPNEDRHLIKELFERRAAGASWPDLTRWLASKGKKYSDKGVRRLITNPTYLGEIHGMGGVANRAAHEPLISKLLWDQAQAAKTTSVRRGPTGSTTGRVICQGLAVCETCGMTINISMRKIKDGHRIYMKCQHAHCTAHASIASEMLDAEVERQVFGRLSIRFRTIWKPRQDSGRESAELKLQQAERVRDDFLDNIDALSLLGKEVWNRELAKITARVDAAKAEVLAIVDEEDLEPSFTRLWEEWQAADVPERRRLLQRVVEKIIVKPVYGKTGIPAEERVVVVIKESRPKPVKIGLAKTG